MNKLNSGISALAASAIALASSSAFAAERTLNTVTALQQTNVLAKAYLKTFVAEANANGKGVIQVKYLGGQEIVPPRKAAAALKRGQFDILSCPTAYYIGTVPEGYGLLASNQGPRALRANGGFALLQKIYKEKAGSHLLAWGENMTSYYMYLGKKPKIGSDGLPDLTGWKMRATGTYRPLFRALGATTITNCWFLRMYQRWHFSATNCWKRARAENQGQGKYESHAFARAVDNCGGCVASHPGSVGATFTGSK